MCKKLIFAVLVLGVFLTSSAYAATIIWELPTEITSLDILNIEGTALVHAASWGQWEDDAGTTNNTVVTVMVGDEVIIFNGTADAEGLASINSGGGILADVTTGGQNHNNDYFDGDTGDEAFNQVMDSFAFDGANPKVLTLNELIVGETYVIQLLTSDDRGCCGARTQLWSDSDTQGAGNESETFAHNDSVSVIGTFVADGPTVTIYGHGVAQNQNILNAYQLRILAPGDIAGSPMPEKEATDVLRNVVLSWEPGEFAAPTNGHKVYFGESFDDVNDATGAVAQTAASYTPPQRLDFNTTYYWRVDEVNAPPTSHVEFKGEVWSFTTELLAYPIDGNNITATAISSSADQIPENTINSSGLDANDLHSTEETDMWLSGGEPNSWIEYKLDKVHKLHEMWVWNSNQKMESFIGFGFKDVKIEYSTNGTGYTTLAGVPEFAQAPGASDYEHNTTVDFNDVAAKYVKLTANKIGRAHV